MAEHGSMHPPSPFQMCSRGILTKRFQLASSVHAVDKTTEYVGLLCKNSDVVSIIQYTDVVHATVYKTVVVSVVTGTCRYVLCSINFSVARCRSPMCGSALTTV